MKVSSVRESLNFSDVFAPVASTTLAGTLLYLLHCRFLQAVNRVDFRPEIYRLSIVLLKFSRSRR